MLFELMPEVEIPVSTGADSEKFQRLFNLAQEKIPEDQRSLIFGFWFGVRFSTLPRKAAPEVQFHASLPGVAAAQIESGFRLLVSIPHLTQMPSKLFMAVLGHELAHVLQHAEGTTWGSVSRAEIESDADDKTRRWGFEIDTAQAWINDFAKRSTNKGPNCAS